MAIGTEQERINALLAKADIYIINRENVDWLVNKSDLPFDFDMVVIDELSSFKSYSAKRFKSLLKVRPKIKRIVGLTGTPSVTDLWIYGPSFVSSTWGKDSVGILPTTAITFLSQISAISR